LYAKETRIRAITAVGLFVILRSTRHEHAMERRMQTTTKSIPITVPVVKAREICGLGNTKLYELIRSGKLRSTLVGSRRLIFVDSLRDLLEKGVR
jgi:hypothetical protein